MMANSITIQIDAVLFDIDGTLADTDSVHARCWRDALLEIEGYSFEVEEYLDQCITGAINPLEFVARRFPGVDISRLAARKAQLYRNALPTVELNDGATELIGSLSELAVPIGVVSSGSSSSAYSFLDICWPTSPPAVVVTRDTFHERKPAPGPYAHALFELGIEPSRAVVFEDSISGEISAVAAGANVVSLCTNAQDADALAHVHRVSSLTSCRVARSHGRPLLTVAK